MDLLLLAKNTRGSYTPALLQKKAVFEICVTESNAWEIDLVKIDFRGLLVSRSYALVNLLCSFCGQAELPSGRAWSDRTSQWKGMVRKMSTVEGHDQAKHHSKRA